MIDSWIHPLLPAVLAALASAAPGDSLVRPVRTLPAVEVAAERVRLDARRRMPTGAVSEAVAGADNRALETVGELLEGSVGARVVSYGSLGAFSSISLRGASPGQVGVLLDGVPLNSAVRGAINLADLPVAAVERIEIYRGATPLGLAAATPGGAVNVVSVDAPSVRTLRVAAGSFGTVTSTGTLGATRGTLAMLVNAGYEGARGNFRFDDDNGTPYAADDDSVTTRLNNRYDAASALARLAWAADPLTRVTLRAEGFHKAQGVPGIGTSQAPHPRFTLERGRLVLESRRAPGVRLPGATLRAHAADERSHFRDPEGELHLGRQDGTTRFADRGLAFELATPAGWPWLSAEAGVAARDETARAASPTLGQAVPPPSHRGTRSAHASVQLHALGERLVLQAGRRWDRQHDALRATLVGGVAYSDERRRTLDTPQLGGRLVLLRGLEARANWTRATRAPEFGELFGDQAIVAANPRLLPEHGENWDAGLGWRAAGRAWRAGADWAHHGSHQYGLIWYQPGSSRTVRATNFTGARIDGDEIAANASWRMLAASGSAAWTHTRQTDPGNIYFGRRLPLRPERQATARIDVRAGAWRVSADVLDLGEDFRDPINYQRLAPRTIVGASIARAWRALVCTVECKNIGDRRVFDVLQYPLPGRSVFVSCELRDRPAGASDR